MPISKSTPSHVVANNIIEPAKKMCFVIMPISNHPDYDTGHFDRVYDEIIKPSVLMAGFEPKRADDIKQTHVIILEILKSIVDYDMAICDLSSLNPNVMYELGIRQMTQKPVVLIKDTKTKRIFDTGVLSDIEYDSDLRVDKVRSSVFEISKSLVNTFENSDSKANSLIELLSIDVKIEKRVVEISEGEKLIMNTLERILERTPVAAETIHTPPSLTQKNRYVKIAGIRLQAGDVCELETKQGARSFKVMISHSETSVTFIDIDSLEISGVSPSNVARIRVILTTKEDLGSVFSEIQIENLRRIEKETGLVIIVPF